MKRIAQRPEGASSDKTRINGERGTDAESGGAAFENIRIDVKLRNVEIDGSGDSAYGYDAVSRPWSKIVHEIRDSNLYITEKLNRQYMFAFILDALRGLRRLSVRVRVPSKAALGAVDLKTTNGHFVIQGIKCETLDLSSASGSISMAAVGADNFNARLTSGRLRLDRCLMGNSSVCTASGEAKITGTTMCGFTMSATSGRTAFSGILTGRTDIRSISGGIVLDIAAKKADYDIDIDTVSGSVNIDGQMQSRRRERPSRSGGGRELRLKTVSGGIRVDFGGKK